MKTKQAIVGLVVALGLAACNLSLDVVPSYGSDGAKEPKPVLAACGDFTFKQTSLSRDAQTHCSDLGEIDGMIEDFTQDANTYTFSLGWLQGREKIEFNQMPVVRGTLNGRVIEEALDCTRTDLESSAVSTRYVCTPLHFDSGLLVQPKLVLARLSLKNASCKTTAEYAVKLQVEDRSLCPEFKRMEDIAPELIEYELNHSRVRSIRAVRK